MSEAFVRAVLSGLPEDRRTALIANWTRNLGVIGDCHPRIHAALDELDEAPGIRAMVAGDALQFHAVGADGGSHLLSGTAQARTRAEALRAQRPDQFYLLAGAGLGPELRALYELTHEPEPMLPNWRIGIYVVEPELAHLALLFLLDDWSDVLADERVRWFCGEKALEDYAAFVFSSDQVVAAKHMVPLSFSPLRQALIEGIREVDELSARCHREHLPQVQQALTEYYAQEGRAHLRAALANEVPLRILGITSRFTSFLQYCMRDLLWGFEQIGAETWLFMEPSDIHRPHPLAVAQAVDQCKPDIVIVIDHFRAEFPYLPESLTYVNWIQDLLPGIMDPSWERLLPNELVYVFSEGFKRTLSRRPEYQDVGLPVLPMGCNPELYRPCEDVPECYDICFVTHLVDPALTFEGLIAHDVAFELTDAERLLISEGHCDEQALLTYYRALGVELRALSLNDLSLLAAGGALVIELFERAIKSVGFRPSKALGIYFKRSDSRFARDILFQVKVRAIRALVGAGLDVRCYGRNWDSVPDLVATAQGEVANGVELNKVMNQARICLHCTGTGYHMRSVEIIASGCFMLCRECDGDLQPITDLFEAGSEIVTFRDELELAALARCYVADTESRRAVAERARSRLLQAYSYDRIAERILRDIGSRLQGNECVSETQARANC